VRIRINSCGGLVLIAALLTGLVPATAAARESACPDLIKRQSAVAQASTDTAPTGRLTAVNGSSAPIADATLVMDFGASRNREVRTQTYSLSAGLDPDTVRVSTVNDIVDGNKTLPIGHQQLTYRAYDNPTTGLVNVRVCYDPGGYREPDAGRYVGALLVTAPGAKAAPLAVEFTLRDNETGAAIIALLIGILAGTAVQAIATFQQTPKKERPSKAWAYIFNFRSAASIGTGVVAAIGAYGKFVEGNSVWEATGPSLLSLAGATFGATLAAKTFVDLKGPTEKEKAKGRQRATGATQAPSDSPA